VTREIKTKSSRCSKSGGSLKRTFEFEIDVSYATGCKDNWLLRHRHVWLFQQGVSEMKKRLLVLVLSIITLLGITACASASPILVPPLSFSGTSETEIAFSCLSEAYTKLGYRKVGSPCQVQLANGRIVVTTDSEGIAQVVWEQDGKQVGSGRVLKGMVLILALGDDGSTKLGIMNCDGLYAKAGTQWGDFVAALPTPASAPKPWDDFLVPQPTPRAGPDHLATLVAMPTISPYLLTPFPTYPSYLLTPMPKLPELPKFPTPIPTFPKFPSLP
jgi:hypothetical protein